MMSVATLGVFSSCHNAKTKFEDFDYTTVYFPYQSPVRTLVLGEDNQVDNTMDNNHQFQVYATIGGVYSNQNDVTIAVEVDNTLCDHLKYVDESGIEYGNVTALPADYYTLEGEQIQLNKEMQGAVTVQLTDKFFADPEAINTKYVLPLMMTRVTGADYLLEGNAVTGVESPIITNVADWAVLPKHYTLYAVKYINPWDASYLRRGEDVIVHNGAAPINVKRQAEFVESDEVCSLETMSMDKVKFPYSLTFNDGSVDITKTCDLELTFSGDKCTIATTTEGVSVESGSGEFKKNTENWGNLDRNAIYLDYKLAFTDPSGVVTTVTVKDTLVYRSRDMKPETFTFVYE